jgi:dTDP-4-amino-4,6-dideoxygalactose transaminase
MRGQELPHWPVFEADERAAVLSVLDSGRVNYWTGGECVAFEREWSQRFGCGPAIAMANGTLTLEASLEALGIGPGDEVIVSPRSYVASSACVARRGARPVFADIAIDSGNVDPDAVASAVNSRTRAIVPVHLAGWPAAMPEIMHVAQRHGLAVIEDCAQAHGAAIGDRSVGAFGTMASWSFCQDKIMTTGGEGGMVSTNDDALWRRCWSLKEHGKSWERVQAEHHPPGFRWLVERHGSNYRMTEMQAAIGRCQLRKLDDWLSARRRNAAIIRQGLLALPFLRAPWPDPPIEHAAYKVYAYLVPDALPRGCTREWILKGLAKAGLPSLTGTCPEIYLETAMAPYRPPQRLPNAAALGETSLVFPCHPTIDAPAAERLATTLVGVLSQLVEAAAGRFVAGTTT